MNKLLNTQLYNRKCLVIANNPAAQSYEEALKKEEVIKMDNTKMRKKINSNNFYLIHLINSNSRSSSSSSSSSR